MTTVSIRLAIEGGKQARGELKGTADQVDRLDTHLGRVESTAVRAARGLGSITARGISSGLRTAATGAGLLAAGLTSVAVAGATVGIKTAASMEQSQIAFTTMLGSGQKAQDFLGKLSTFAAQTPFDMPGLTTAASSLVSAGIDADKVIPIMTSLGNATSGMGTGAEGIQRATVALQQMNAAQKITGEDLNQLRDAGIPVFDLLAAATGKSKEEVAGLAQAGKLGKKELDQLMGALESGKGLERFNGLMEKQSQSLNGLWSSFQDTLGMGLAGAMQPLIPLLKDGVTWATAFAQASMPALTAAVSTAAGWISRFIDGFKQTGPATESVRALGSQARDAFNAVWGFLSGIDWAGTWQTITDAISAVKGALGGIDFATLGTGLQSFGQQMTGGGTAATLLSGGAQILGGALQFLADHMDTILKYMPAIAAGFAIWKLSQQAAIAVEIAGLPLRVAEIAATFALASSNRALAAAMGYTRTSRIRAMAVAVKDFALKVKDAAIIGLLAIRYVAYQVAIGLVTVASKVAAVATRAFGIALRFATGPIGIIIGVITVLAGLFVLLYKKNETFRNFVNGAWAMIKGAISTVWDWISGTLWPGLQNFFTSAVDKAVGFWHGVQDAWNGLKAGVQSVWDWLSNTLWPGVVAVWDGIRTGISNAVTGVITWVKDHWQLILGILTGPIGIAVGQIITHWDSIKNGAQTAFNGVKGFIQGVIDKVQGFIDKIKQLPEIIRTNVTNVIGKIPGGSAVLSALGVSAGDATHRAMGGPVSAGSLYMTGEQGRELFVPTQDGVVLNHRQTLAALAPTTLQLPSASSATDDFDIPELGSLAAPIHTHVYLNDREIATAVTGVYQRQMARA